MFLNILDNPGLPPGTRIYTPRNVQKPSISSHKKYFMMTKQLQF